MYSGCKCPVKLTGVPGMTAGLLLRKWVDMNLTDCTGCHGENEQ